MGLEFYGLCGRVCRLICDRISLWFKWHHGGLLPKALLLM